MSLLSLSQISKAGEANDRLKENLIEALKRQNTGNFMQTMTDSIDMDSATDKALKVMDKIIYGEKVWRTQRGDGMGKFRHGHVKV